MRRHIRGIERPAAALVKIDQLMLGMRGRRSSIAKAFFLVARANDSAGGPAADAQKGAWNVAGIGHNSFIIRQIANPVKELPLSTNYVLHMAPPADSLISC